MTGLVDDATHNVVRTRRIAADASRHMIQPKVFPGTPRDVMLGARRVAAPALRLICRFRREARDLPRIRSHHRSGCEQDCADKCCLEFSHVHTETSSFKRESAWLCLRGAGWMNGRAGKWPEEPASNYPLSGRSCQSYLLEDLRIFTNDKKREKTCSPALNLSCWRFLPDCRIPTSPGLFSFSYCW
jgi:hypothetical protein